MDAWFFLRGEPWWAIMARGRRGRAPHGGWWILIPRVGVHIEEDHHGAGLRPGSYECSAPLLLAELAPGRRGVLQPTAAFGQCAPEGGRTASAARPGCVARLSPSDATARSRGSRAGRGSAGGSRAPFPCDRARTGAALHRRRSAVRAPAPRSPTSASEDPV